jgi:hypothetical protein
LLRNPFLKMVLLCSSLDSSVLRISGVLGNIP